MRKGKIIPNGVILEMHENTTVVFLTECGFDIELIPLSHRKGAKTADLIMGGVEWEMKAPMGDSKYTIEHAFRAALKQSPNIIFDLRRSKMSQQKCIREIVKRFENSGIAQRLLIIPKSKKMLDFEK